MRICKKKHKNRYFISFSMIIEWRKFLSFYSHQEKKHGNKSPIIPFGHEYFLRISFTHTMMMIVVHDGGGSKFMIYQWWYWWIRREKKISINFHENNMITKYDDDDDESLFSSSCVLFWSQKKNKSCFCFFFWLWTNGKNIPISIINFQHCHMYMNFLMMKYNLFVQLNLINEWMNIFWVWK